MSSFLCKKIIKDGKNTMKIKELREKRNDIVNAMKLMTEVSDNFNAEDFNAREVELTEIDNKIAALEKVENLTQVEDKKENNDLKNKIMNGTEIKLANEHTTSTTGQVIKETFADTIEKKLSNVSPLYQMVRKIVTSNPYTIPVQAGKLGKFVKTAELSNYVNQKANFATIQLGAEKYTNLVTISKELLNDDGYNLEQELIEQLVEALALTLDELIVKGDGTVEGLNGFDTTKGAKKVVQGVAGTITIDEVIDMYYALPVAYRPGACWIISDSMAKMLTKLKDADGRPVLSQSYVNGVLESSILGRPVVINDFVDAMATGKKAMFFVNLDRALVVGLRKDMEIVKSTEYGFINDSVAIKADTRLDVKKLIEESCAYYECK